MPAAVNPFDTAAMAAGYAVSRPPLHAPIVQKIARSLPGPLPVGRALDLGCGSGLSAKPLSTLSAEVYALEPVESMAKLVCAVAPQAHVFIARGEQIPLPSKSMDLVTAAGSLNYMDTARAFREVARILSDHGVMAVYDFAPGELAPWYCDFVARYPKPDLEALTIDPQWLAANADGFRVTASESLAMEVPFRAPEYRDYVLTESNVAAAVRRGIPIDEIREWCEHTLTDHFADGTRAVLFRGYIACLTPIG